MAEVFELVTRIEAARMCGVNPRVITEASRSGALRAKLVGRQYRIAVSDLRAWFESLPNA